MEKQKELSIIIVSYNVKKYLRECIQSIYETCGKIDCEIIVVDNNSSDNSIEMLKDEFSAVTIIENTNNKGFAAANNQGIRISRGRYVLLLNPDTVVLSNSLGNMLEFMDGHCEAGAVGCRIVNPDGTLQSSCRNFHSLPIIFFESTGLYKLFSKNVLLAKYYLRYWNHNTIRVVDSVKGACLMVRREVIEKIGLLDERFFLYGEEVDFCKRIKEKGWFVFFIPHAQIIHHCGKSSQLQEPKNLIEQHRSRYQYIQKHFGKTTARLGQLISGCGVFLRTIACIPFFFLGKEEKERAVKRFTLFYTVLKWYLSGQRP